MSIFCHTHQNKRLTFNWMQNTAGNRRNLEDHLKLVVIIKFDSDNYRSKCNF